MHTLKELRMTNTEENYDGRKQSKIATYIINTISSLIKSIFSFIMFWLIFLLLQSILFSFPFSHLDSQPLCLSLESKQKSKE